MNAPDTMTVIPGRDIRDVSRITVAGITVAIAIRVAVPITVVRITIAVAKPDREPETDSDVNASLTSWCSGKRECADRDGDEQNLLPIHNPSSVERFQYIIDFNARCRKKYSNDDYSG
jgi:hypothetical protein